MKEVIRMERGWAGHFIGSSKCLFRRNTLLCYNDIKIVVSTVGRMVCNGDFHEIGYKRHFETMVFHAEDDKYQDANVSREIVFESKWTIENPNEEIEANEMHENVVSEITEKLLNGDKNQLYEIPLGGGGAIFIGEYKTLLEAIRQGEALT